MGQRNSGYRRKQNDYYPTPDWVTQALLPHLPTLGGDVWEPAAGCGAMARALAAGLGCPVHVSDIAPQCETVREADFFSETHAPRGVGAIITNSPYGRCAPEFARHAVRLMREVDGVVALLLRTQFDHAPTYRDLFADCPAWGKKVQLLRRIVWFVDPETEKPKAGPSDCHSWYIWDWARSDAPPTLAYGDG